MTSLDNLLSSLDWFVLGAYFVAGMGCIVFVMSTMLWRPMAKIVKPSVSARGAVRR